MPAHAPRSQMQETASQYTSSIFELLNYNLFILGDARITPLTLIYIVLLAGVLIYLSGKLKDLMVKRLLARLRLDTGAQHAIGTITRYVVLLVGTLVILQTVGINLTTLNVLAGAVGIGIGFGLQNIANNFISGLIILFERPIKIGDRIEVQGITGQVQAISARSTVVRTNDNISIIVPNSKFISENVVNWSFAGNHIRFRVPVLVAYGSDLDLVTKILSEVAIENDDVVSDPPPTVRLLKFEDRGIYFELRAWSRTRVQHPGAFKSALNFEIYRRFVENGIEFAETKRDSQANGERPNTEYDDSLYERPKSRSAESARQ